MCIDSSSNPAKRRIYRNTDFSFLALRVLLLFSEVDLTQRSGQIWANFGRKLRFFESRQDRSRIIRGSSRSHLEVVWGLESLRGRRMRNSGSGGGGLRPPPPAPAGVLKVWANFGRKLRFFESRQDRSRIIRGSSGSHLEVIL